MARFYPNRPGSIRLVTAQGTWTGVAGSPIDVDNRTAAIFREAFLRGGDVLVEQATPPDLGGGTTQTEPVLQASVVYEATVVVEEGFVIGQAQAVIEATPVTQSTAVLEAGLSV